MRTAIRTSYLGATEHQGSRILVVTEAGRKTYPYDHGLDAFQNHQAAAMAYAAQMGWAGRWNGGQLQDSFVWTCEARASAFVIESGRYVMSATATQPAD